MFKVSIVPFLGTVQHWKHRCPPSGVGQRHRVGNGEAAWQSPADRVAEALLRSFFLHREKSKHLLAQSLFRHRTETRSVDVKMSGAEVAARTPAQGQLFHCTIGDGKGNIQAGDTIIGQHLHCSHEAELTSLRWERMELWEAKLSHPWASAPTREAKQDLFAKGSCPNAISFISTTVLVPSGTDEAKQVKN